MVFSLVSETTKVSFLLRKHAAKKTRKLIQLETSMEKLEIETI